jgi:photosystem II stability/assembly factor-like uncharacterized protein
VVLSDDGGRSWRQASSVPTRALLTGVCFADARLGWAVGHDAVVLHSRDGGEHWKRQHAAPEREAPLLSVWCDDASRVLATGAFGLALETRDGGRSWTRTVVAAEGQDPHLNTVFATADGTHFIAAEFGRVFRRQPGSTAWVELEVPYPGSFWGGLALRSGAILIFGLRGHVFRSEDKGEHWTEIASGTDQSLSGGTELRDERVVLAGLGGVVLLSDDGGRSFTRTIRPERRGAAAVLGGDGASILIFGEKGVETLERPGTARD